VAVSNELKDLLQRIFVADSRKRIDMNQIFEHPWFLKDLPAPVLESRNTRRQSSQNLEKLNQVIADAKVTA
jgi:serine/threonine-protein kinase SRK2